MSRAANAGKVLSDSTARAFSNYFKRSELPLHSLAFLLPAMFLFEVGARFHPADPIAFRLLQVFFGQLGASGRYVPFLALTAILLAWHMARKDPWGIKIETLWGMALESWLLSLPLLALGIAVARWNIHVPLYTDPDQWRSNTILALGAGIYEEFVFRLLLMTSLMLILADLFRLHKGWANLLMVVVSAVLFSLYHYLGSEPFQLRSFVFRTVAGLYFAILFLVRGFGVTSGCHIAYDVLIITLQAMAIH